MVLTGPTIVKLGGSVITRKPGEARVRTKVLTRLGQELADGPRAPLVVLHGAGSFGHAGAIRWNLARPPGRPSDPHRARGAAIVSTEVRRLHLEVLRALVDGGLAPLSLPPVALARNREGRLSSFEAGPFGAALGSGMTAVSFGDVVLDDVWEFSILSADTIAQELARVLLARRVIFVSDVEGVLGPTDGRRRPVVRELTRDAVEKLAPSAAGPDVTGGIRGKAEAMLAIAEAGCDAGLISGLKDGALSRAIRGEAVYGTWAKAVSR